MKKTNNRIAGIAVSALMMLSSLPLSQNGTGADNSLIMPISAEALDYSEAYHYRTINGETYVYASALIFKVTKNSTSLSSPGTVSIVGIHSSAARNPYNYNITVPAYIKFAGRRYDITAVEHFSHYAQDVFNSSTVRRDCEQLKSIDFSKCMQLKVIKERACWWMVSLESVKLPKNLERIESSAFGYTPLKSISIPSAKSIGSLAFAGTPNLTSIVLPTNLNTIEEDVFHNSGISSITFQNTNASTFNPSAEIFGTNTPKLTTLYLRNAGIFGKLVKNSSLKGASNLKTIRNQQNQPILYYQTQADGYQKPVMFKDYYDQLQANFVQADWDRIAIFEEYFAGYRSYIAKSVTKGCLTQKQKIKALHDWICNKVRYAYIEKNVPDPGDYCHVDSSVFMGNKTVCDGYARAMKLLLDEVGIESYILVTKDTQDHAWVMVKMGSSYYHLDACHDDDDDDDDGDRQYIEYSHFLKSDDDIRKCLNGHEDWVYADDYLNHKTNTRIKMKYPSTMQPCYFSSSNPY